MSKSELEARQKKVIRTFFARVGLLIGLILLVGWAAWIAPRNRDTRITVESARPTPERKTPNAERQGTP